MMCFFAPAQERRGTSKQVRDTEKGIERERSEDQSEEDRVPMRWGRKRTFKLQDIDIPRVNALKYLGSTVQDDGGEDIEVERISAAWHGWRKITGIICDRRVPNCVIGRFYTTMVRPAMLYGRATQLFLTGATWISLELPEV